MGTHKTILDKKDQWTVRTADGKLSAQFEHSIAISADGPILLTLP
jgi:methionyl aminopeptidase